MEQAGIDVHTRAAQLGHTANVNRKHYIERTFDDQSKALKDFEGFTGDSAAVQ